MVQVKSVKTGTQFQTSGTGNYSSGTQITELTINITPQSSTNTMLVMLSTNGMIYGSGTEDHGVIIKANGSEIKRVNCYKADNTWDAGNWSGTVLHSPSSTTEQAYTVWYYRDGGNANDFRLNRNGDSTLTVMEIAG